MTGLSQLGWCLISCNNRSNDSNIQQLIAITHDIFTTFDANPFLLVRGVFFDLSEALDRVWHK